MKISEVLVLGLGLLLTLVSGMHDLGRCRDRFCNTHDTAKINHPVKAENYGLDKIAPKISSMSPRVQFNSGQGFKDYYSAIKVLTTRPRTPVFDPSVPTKVTTDSDTTAILSCKVHHLGNHTVSWMRHDDLNILSVGRLKYSSDNRYEVVYRANTANTNEYQLHIHYVQPRDTGVYECQVSTQPIRAFYIELKVTEGDPSLIVEEEAMSEEPMDETTISVENTISNSEILGHPDLYYRLGEMINLTCVISGTAGPPRDIFWYHNQSVIGFYSERKVIILEDKGETSTSQLLLKDADKNDQGSYRCEPSNSEEAHTRVFVLDELEYDARQAALTQGLNSANALVNTDLLCKQTKAMAILIVVLLLSGPMTIFL